MLPPNGVLSVSELTAAIKEFLETGFPSLVVEGEISGLRSTSGKHLYFSLKDETAVLKVVWFSWNSKTAVPPSEGQQVRITGRLAVYEPQGVYQLVASQVEPVGLGDLLARLERLKIQLEGEGLFAAERKRPIPAFPAIIGLVTSSTGAALQDMLRIFLAANLRSTIRIFPATVQGNDAAAQISAMIRYAGAAKLADVLVVGRGGGSVEDLLAFSDERVVRAVAESEVPVVSAVGHEIDTPLCDFAADYRCPTPTAAAEMLSRPWLRLESELADAKQAMEEGIRGRLNHARLTLSDFRSDRLRESFRRLLEPLYQRYDFARESLLQGWSDRITGLKHRFALAKTTLDGADPRGLLRRGYTLVRTAQGLPVTSVQSLEPGNTLSIQFYDGRAETTVKEIVHEDL